MSVPGLVVAGMLAAAAARAAEPTPPPWFGKGALSTPASSATTLQAGGPQFTMTIPGAVVSGTVLQAPAASSTVQAPAVPARLQAGPAGKPGFTRTAAAGPAKPPVPYEELHRRASLVMCPTAYAAHFKGPTGENAEVFLLWYIGTLYDQRGLSIAPISTLFIGADLKWAFLSERGGRPAAAIGYLGGLEVPFTGGVVRVSTLANQTPIRQAFVHDVYAVLSRNLGPIAVSGGALYGIKKAFPVILPMLRNPNFSTIRNTPPPPEIVWTAFAGFDLTLAKRHFKVEVMTLPQVNEDRPWLVNTYLGGILGFDFAYLRDRIGWELLGYYQLPFFRWPDQKRLEKERDRMTAARRRP